MELQELLSYLALAELHVGDGQRHIKQQQELVRQIECEGGDTTASRAILGFLLDVQAQQRADRDHLLREIVRLRLAVC